MADYHRRYFIATYKKVPRKVKPVQKEFVGYVEQAIAKVLPYWKKIVATLVAVLAVVALLWTVAIFLHSKDERSAEKFFEITKLQDEGAKVEMMEDFIDENSGTPSADQARMWLGAYYYDKGDSKKAIDLYKEIVEKREGKPVYFIAVESLAPVYVSSGEAEDAAELYLEAGNMAANPAPFTYKMKAADIYKIAGKADDAKKILSEVISDKNASEEVKRKAQEKLLWVDISSK